MLGWNPVKCSHVGLGLVPKVFAPIDMIFLFGKDLGMINAGVFEPRHIQDIIATPASSLDDTIRLNLFLNDRP